MGTYTPVYKLFKAGDGSVDPNNDDYVDPVSQLDYNLNKIDDFAQRALEYKFYNNVPLSVLPVTGNNQGDKLHTNYDSSAKLWDGTSWVSTNAKNPIWTDATPNAGYQTNGTDNNPGYYLDTSSNTVFLRGVIIKTSLAIWTQGTVYSVFPAGRFPLSSPAVVKTLHSIGGTSTSRVAQFYQISVNADGSMSITKYGANAQTAGNAENYVSLEGLHYGVS